MSNTAPEKADETPPLSMADLCGHFQRGEKAEGKFRIGVEHEKIGMALYEDGSVGPVPYEDAPGRPQVRTLLRELTQVGWDPVEEAGNIIALKRPRGGSVTLEPGGQFEISGPPFDTAVLAVHDLLEHMRELLPISDRLGIAFVSCGFRPLGTWADVPWMPKGRYRVMREYLPKKGSMGLEMMKRTATVQANLDYKSEQDAIEKLRLSISLSSLATAMFAASPLVDGRPSGYQSYRAACWLDTDNQRCGLLPFVYRDGASYRDYVEWALDVPMFFVYRHKTYHPVSNLPFRRFLHEGWNGEQATLADWDLHLSTLFPDTRLRQYVEMRGADSGPMELVQALPCLWRGVLYYDEGRRAAWDLVGDWTWEERQQLRQDVPRLGMKAMVRGKGIGPLCQELVEIAQRGLRSLGSDEGVKMLEPLLHGARERRSHADHILDVYEKVKGEPRALVEELRYRLR